MKIYHGNIKNIAFLIISALFLTAATHCYADSASVKIICTEGEVDVAIRNINGGELTADGLITWSDVNAGQTGWKAANQYIEISHADLPLFWGMQLYTDNKNVSANPRYTGTADPVGLVKTDNTIFSLPMAWRITDSVINPNSDEDKPVQRPDASGFTNYMWHFLKDKNTPDNPLTEWDESFSNAEEYVTLWNQAGIAWNEGARQGNPAKAYIYLAANFTMSSVESEYKTSALTIEAYKGISPFPLYLYKDGDSLKNHYAPSGWMGDVGSLAVDGECVENLLPGSESCFRISWDGEGSWAGIIWQEPKNEWTGGPGKGYDLRGAVKLKFDIRSSVDNALVRIGMGYVNDSCGAIHYMNNDDVFLELGTDWQEIEVDLEALNAPGEELDMSHVSNGFQIIISEGYPFDVYLDNIRYETQ